MDSGSNKTFLSTPKMHRIVDRHKVINIWVQSMAKNRYIVKKVVNLKKMALIFGISRINLSKEVKGILGQTYGVQAGEKIFTELWGNKTLPKIQQEIKNWSVSQYRIAESGGNPESMDAKRADLKTHGSSIAKGPFKKYVINGLEEEFPGEGKTRYDNVWGLELAPLIQEEIKEWTLAQCQIKQETGSNETLNDKIRELQARGISLTWSTFTKYVKQGLDEQYLRQGDDYYNSMWGSELDPKIQQEISDWIIKQYDTYVNEGRVRSIRSLVKSYKEKGIQITPETIKKYGIITLEKKFPGEGTDWFENIWTNEIRAELQREIKDWTLTQYENYINKQPIESIRSKINEIKKRRIKLSKSIKKYAQKTLDEKFPNQGEAIFSKIWNNYVEPELQANIKTWALSQQQAKLRGDPVETITKKLLTLKEKGHKISWSSVSKYGFEGLEEKFPQKGEEIYSHLWPNALLPRIQEKIKQKGVDAWEEWNKGDRQNRPTPIKQIGEGTGASDSTIIKYVIRGLQEKYGHQKGLDLYDAAWGIDVSPEIQREIGDWIKTQILRLNSHQVTKLESMQSLADYYGFYVQTIQKYVKLELKKFYGAAKAESHYHAFTDALQQQWRIGQLNHRILEQVAIKGHLTNLILHPDWPPMFWEVTPQNQHIVYDLYIPDAYKGNFLHQCLAQKLPDGRSLGDYLGISDAIMQNYIDIVVDFSINSRLETLREKAKKYCDGHTLLIVVSTGWWQRGKDGPVRDPNYKDVFGINSALFFKFLQSPESEYIQAKYLRQLTQANNLKEISEIARKIKPSFESQREKLRQYEVNRDKNERQRHLEKPFAMQDKKHLVDIDSIEPRKKVQLHLEFRKNPADNKKDLSQMVADHMKFLEDLDQENIKKDTMQSSKVKDPLQMVEEHMKFLEVLDREDVETAKENSDAVSEDIADQRVEEVNLPDAEEAGDVAEEETHGNEDEEEAEDDHEDFV